MVIGIVLATTHIDVVRAFRLAFARAASPAYALADTLAITAILGLSVLSIAAGSYSPFLYFRF